MLFVSSKILYQLLPTISDFSIIQEVLDLQSSDDQASPISQNSPSSLHNQLFSYVSIPVPTAAEPTSTISSKPDGNNLSLKF